MEIPSGTQKRTGAKCLDVTLLGMEPKKILTDTFGSRVVLMMCSMFQGTDWARQRSRVLW